MPDQLGGGQPLSSDPLSIASAAADQTLRVVEKTNERVADMLKRGYGVTFLAFGFVTVVAAVLLRVYRDTEITPAVFIALLVLALCFVAMSFTFLYMDARIAQETTRTVAEHHERVTAALIEYQRQLHAQAGKTGEQIIERERELGENLQGPRNPAGVQT